MRHMDERIGEDLDRLQSPRSAEAADLAPAAEGLLQVGLRCVVAAGLSLVPGVGAGIAEGLAAYRERQADKSFQLFAYRVEVLERNLGEIASADQYLRSAEGTEHVARVLEAVRRAEGEAHRDALAAAYVSGIGYGRFQPSLVLLLDGALGKLTEYHVQVVRWCYEKQGGLNLRGRLQAKIEMEDLASEVVCPPAILQKVISDLAEAHILMDCGVNKIGGYWGILSFALTSFGMSFAQYIREPQRFVETEPELESPIPSTPER